MTIAGYDYGDVASSPVTLRELAELKETLLWSDEDTAALRKAGDVLSDQISDVLDLWYGYVGSHAHLVQSFNGADGTPDAAYLDRVRARFGQWITDLTTRDFDQEWLDYQHEIGLRHAPDKKNVTDGIESDQQHIPLRSMIAFIWPITATIRSFLAANGHDPDEVDAMHTAWFKAVTLSTVLWARPYAPALW